MNKKLITIVISCYFPSNQSILVADKLREILKKFPDRVELRYLFNGLDNEHKEIRADICTRLQNLPNCEVLSEENNLGVGLGYQVLCDGSYGEYIYCLTDDDLIDKNNIEEIISLLGEQKIDFAHQLLDDVNYIESEVFTKTFDISCTKFLHALAYAGYRFGALPGTIFSSEIYHSRKRHWKDKLYPWIEIVFDNEEPSFAIFSPLSRIKVESGAPVHLRFNDRVKRGMDYGFNERLNYVSKLRGTSRQIYEYLLIRWIAKIYRSLKIKDKKLASAMLLSLEIPSSRRVILAFCFNYKLEMFSTLESFYGCWKWNLSK